MSFAISLSIAILPSVVRAQCRPGDHLIGEDAKNYYCSKKTCKELDEQLVRDKQALGDLENLIQTTNDELKSWTKNNNAAAEGAFRHAATFLHDSLLGKLEDISQSRLEKVEQEFARHAPYGDRWQRLLEESRQLESQTARLNGAIDGLKLSQYPFSNLTTAWTDLKDWATKVGRNGDTVSATLEEMRKDPEGAAILRENRLSFASDGLKLALAPVLARNLSMGEFFVNYGYDAFSWEKSRQRIMQNIENQNANLIAVCKLSEQLKKTVRDNNVCHGKYPAPDAAIPDTAKCK